MRNFKTTKIRTALINLFRKDSFPLSISEILIILKKENLNPNKTTIYREIEFLTKLGIVSEVDFGEGKKRFEGKGEHHHHIVCINCKKVTDIKMEKDLESFHAKITKQAGYKPVGHSLEFFGLCENCQKEV